MTQTIDPASEPARLQGGDFVRRHGFVTRIWHWVNAATMLIMLMSGLMIFNAHPALYWGQYGANPDPAWLTIDDRGGEGFLRVGELTVPTTGVLGVYTDSAGRTRTHAFPGWATIPSNYSLSQSRRWHLTFAWLFVAGIVVYGVWSLARGHWWRDLLPSRDEMRPNHIWTHVKHHATLRLPRGEAARHYNILQKIAYLAVVLVLLPLMILTGLTMSPAMDAAWPWLTEVFGGRQSARSIHFITATLLVLFVIVHLVMVLLAGPFNEVRSMITGRFRLPKERDR